MRAKTKRLTSTAMLRGRLAMKLGIAIFPADYAIRPDELARAVEERGFESLFFTDHTHIPATPETAP
jgi:hypothetical protein